MKLTLVQVVAVMTLLLINLFFILGKVCRRDSKVT